MRKMETNLIIRSKPRGLKRKNYKMVERILSCSNEFPSEWNGHSGYWNSYLPVNQGFIDSNQTPKSVRKLCAQTLLDASKKLVDIKPKTDEKIRVVTSISLPEMFGSQITVFFRDDYFSSFFDRNSVEQKWIALPPKRNIALEWGLSIPIGFSVKGYKEEIHDEYYDHTGEIWFIGELT